MFPWIQRVWRDPVWSKVIATAIGVMASTIFEQSGALANVAGTALRTEATVPAWIIVLLFIGLTFLITLVVWLTLRHFSRASSARASSSLLDYGIRITAPIDGQRVDSPVEVRGTFDSLPPDKEIRIVEYIPAGETYWPKTKVIISTSTKTWMCKVWFGDRPGVHHTLYVAQCGPDAEALFDLFFRVEQAAGRPTGIKVLTRDVLLTNPVTVERGAAH